MSTAARGAAPAAALLDSGVLIALHLRNDPHHADVVRWFEAFHGVLHTIEAVLTETAYFLPPAARGRLADLAASGRLRLHNLDSAAHVRMAQLFRKYADQDPDWTDIALVWLAESTRVMRIATLDVADFSVYRVDGRKRFELELLR